MEINFFVEMLESIGDIKDKIRAIGAIEAALSPHTDRRQIVYYAEYGTDDENDEITKKQSSRVTAFVRKLKFIGRFSFMSKSRDNDIKRKKSIKAKIRFVGRFLTPKKDNGVEGGRIKFGSFLRKIKFATKLSPKTPVDNDVEDTSKKEEEEEKEDKVSDKPKSVGSTKNLLKKLCPCLAKKNEPELLEYQSGSRVMSY